jgi:hypothetical protein
MLPEWTIVGFSGHRNLHDPRIAAEGIHAALDRLTTSSSPLASISSLAAGADTIFVKEMERRHQPFFLVLPFTKSRFEKDFSTEEWKHILPLLNKASGIEENVIGESLEEPYMEAGALIVERSDLVLVVWDGAAASGAGGTGDVVDYARAMNKPLLIIDPISGEIAEERLKLLPSKHTSNSTVTCHDNPHKMVQEEFLDLDKAAQGHSTGVRHLVSVIIIFQLLSAALGLGALTLDFHHTHETTSNLITVFELFLLIAAFALTFQHRKKHQQWIRNRIQAEISRSFLATWHLRGHGDYTPTIAVQGFNRFCRNLQLIRHMDKTSHPSLKAVREKYLVERIQGQIKHFKRQYGMANQAYEKLKFYAVLGTALAAIFTAATLVFSLLNFSDSAYTVVKVLSLLLPLISAALFSLIVTQDYSRRAARYREMVDVLEDVEKRLNIIRTWTSLARIAAEAETELLQEIVEWQSFQRFAGEPH